MGESRFKSPLPEKPAHILSPRFKIQGKAKNNKKREGPRTP